jgi:hypothetical protein
VVRLVSSTGHWDPEKRTNKGQVAVWDVKNAKKLRTIFEYDGYARNMMGQHILVVVPCMRVRVRVRSCVGRN